MLDKARIEQLKELIQSLSKEEIIWINGFSAGYISNEPVEQKEQLSTIKPSIQKITIAYGTETGNSKKLATDFALKAKKNGIVSKVIGLDQYRLTDLSKEEYFLVIASTHGDGEPPIAAKKFYDFIHENTISIPNLKYSVLALGDTSYPLFCQTGEDIDNQLAKLGGNRIIPLKKCDIEYENDANKWFENIFQALSTQANDTQVSKIAAVASVTKKTIGKKTYTGEVITSINLNARDSNKETYHIEIAAEELDYLPGDSIGIVPENPFETVDNIIKLTGIDAEKTIAWRKEEGKIIELLTKQINIHYLLESTIKKIAAIIQQDIPPIRMDLLDLIKIYSIKDANQFEEIIGVLNPIPPRLYTIASSPNAHSGEVHLTVEKDKFTVNDQDKYGLCSNYLSLVNQGNQIPFFVQPNKRFKLPDGHKDIIMIGPGTGIAPFRSFVAERDATGATGKNWLFFGSQHFTKDFLYQTEWQNWYATGALTKISVAFSRDQQEKKYVQHRMLEQAQELFSWINNGAHVYICGNKDRMSVQVEKTLLQIIEQQGNINAEGALKYLEDLKLAGRYEKDVY